MSDYQFEAESESGGEPQGPVNWDGVEYGGFWIRLVAMIIDDIIAGILFFWLLGVQLLGLDFLYASNMSTPAGVIVQYILPAIYAIGFWIALRATPGKMALGLVIVDAKTGQQASTARYIIRYIAYYLSFVVLLLGFIWVAFNPRKRGWHDLIAGTVVVKKDSL